MHCDEFVLYVVRVVCVLCVKKNNKTTTISTHIFPVYHLPIKMTALDFVTDVNAPDDCCRNSGTPRKHRQTIFVLIYSEAAVWSSHKQVDEKRFFCVCVCVCSPWCLLSELISKLLAKIKPTPDTNSNNIADMRYRSTSEMCLPSCGNTF